MSAPDHWIPHAREDGEVIGWIDMDASDAIGDVGYEFVLDFPAGTELMER